VKQYYLHKIYLKLVAQSFYLFIN